MSPDRALDAADVSESDRVGLQPDIYQRYELLRRIVHQSHDDTSSLSVRVLDLGSGPQQFTQQALGAGFDIVRADVGDFDDSEIVKLVAGSPLPFDDNDFDIVIAMDVLEHLPPALRSEFIAQCARVASDLVVIACPTASDAVRGAEAEARATMIEVVGQSPDFLDEHELFGLPELDQSKAELARHCANVETVANAPLTTWKIANMIDFVLSVHESQRDLKSRVASAINNRSVVCPTDAPGYRTFFLGSPSGAVDVNALATSLGEPARPEEGATVVAFATDLLTTAIWELRSNADAHIGRRRALELQVASLESAMQRVHRSNDELVRTSSDALAVADEPQPSTRSVVPPALRGVAGKARRSPQWAARQLRASYGSGRTDSGAPARFDRQWYLVSNPDVARAGADPWSHYVQYGRAEGRAPHPLFDASWYAERYPDLSVGGGDAFLDWAHRANSPRRDPNEFFDGAWYERTNPDVEGSGLDAVEHYHLHGWREGRRPGPLFDPRWYLATYPDVAKAEIEPLSHYLQFGRREGRYVNHLEDTAVSGRYRPPSGLIPWFDPVRFEVRDELAASPRLNVLIPGLGIQHMTGGPNTAIQLAYRLAALGQDVRFISSDAPLDDDVAPLWAHMASISEVGTRLPNVEIVDGSDRFSNVGIGENDTFMATAWWTAQSVKAVLPLMRYQRFVYLIQDFEPLFFASSSQYALALETYELDHLPVVNSRFLLDHLAREGIGRFADRSFVERALVFEPTVDRSLFRPAVITAPRERRRLLFYARPQNGLRNLFELGVAALQLAVQKGVFDEDDWDFVGMGEQFEPVAVGPRSLLTPAPWKDLAGYAAQMRESDILLSPMLAPHPSYPPLEMAACGQPVVTTVFGPKTADRLAEVSENIIATNATIEGLAQGLADAVDRLEEPARGLAASVLNLPSTWHEVFETVLPELRSQLERPAESLGGTLSSASAGPPDRYERWLRRRISERSVPPPPSDVGADADVVLSLMTAVWNTRAEFLRALADSVLNQELDHGWEWVIIDNGSSDPATRAVLDELVGDHRVRLERSDSNLGILGGLRSCLERATGRYVIHVDHDDVLTPDALGLVVASLAGAGWPEAFYSDEDKLLGERHLDPYLKPDWDPILFSNSCYVAHLCGVDRERALELDAYLDPATEASPDWDLFTRFANAGVVPHHIDEVLYSWRIHSSSTAGNPQVKPYFVETHRRVIERFVDARADSNRFEVVVHPDSPSQVDWWMRRLHVEPRPLVTVVVGKHAEVPVAPLPILDHRVRVVGSDDHTAVVAIAEDAARRGALVHLLNATGEALRSDWFWEALGLFELHPDVAAVGGPVERTGRIVSAGAVFGFGPTGWGSPAAGEPAEASGWFGQILKQRSVDGIAGDHMVFDAGRLVEFLRDSTCSHPATIGAEFSHYAAQNGWRIAYSPLLRARVAAPFEESWTDAERARIGARSAELASGRNRSLALSLDARRPHGFASAVERSNHLERLQSTARPPSQSYQGWLTDRSATRSDRYPPSEDDPSISIITPVYSGTDAAYFAMLAESIERQTQPVQQWIVGLDGDISNQLQHQIDAVRTRFGVRFCVVGGPKAGILATMSSCLRSATSDYVVPVDADDVLTDDAVAILSSAAATNGRPDLLYSDEDIIDDSGVRDPFLRPDWDPALNIASSYIWHALCVHRDTATAVGLYEDPAFEWCHDWDTVERVRRAGGSIIHVPEVLYHWRHHSGSSTNTVDPEIAQHDSVRAVLQRIADDTAQADSYEVAEYPLWRGAKEYHLRRRPTAPPSLSIVVLGQWSQLSNDSVARCSTYPITRIHECPAGTVGDVGQLLGALDSEFVWVLSSDMVFECEEPAWEAVKWFELLSDVGVVSGRTLGFDGRVETGAAVRDPDHGERLLVPMAGQPGNDPGPYALGLKPHSVDVFEPSSFLARPTQLRDALSDLPCTSTPGELARDISSWFNTNGLRLVYDPLMVGLLANASGASTESDAVFRHEVVGRAHRAGLAPVTWGRRRFR